MLLTFPLFCQKRHRSSEISFTFKVSACTSIWWFYFKALSRVSSITNYSSAPTPPCAGRWNMTKERIRTQGLNFRPFEHDVCKQLAVPVARGSLLYNLVVLKSTACVRLHRCLVSYTTKVHCFPSSSHSINEPPTPHVICDAISSSWDQRPWQIACLLGCHTWLPRSYLWLRQVI